MVDLSKKGRVFISTGSIENAFMKVWICFQKQRMVEGLIYELRMMRELWAVGKAVLGIFFFQDDSDPKPEKREACRSDQNEELHLSSKTEILLYAF